MRTGILGGTFDPIHIAHLHAGETALHQLGLDRVLFMPAGDPWQKTDRLITPAAHRLEMVRIAIEGVDGLAVDDREILRDGDTYTIDTLESFPADEEMFLVVGADAALGLMTWKEPERILERATVVVAPRPGTDSTEVARLLPDAVFLDMTVLDVSGTVIREMARTDVPFRFLVTGPVHDYVVANRLYAEAGEPDIVGVPNETEESS